jgi:hypothetical protein
VRRAAPISFHFELVSRRYKRILRFSEPRLLEIGFEVVVPLKLGEVGVYGGVVPEESELPYELVGPETLPGSPEPVSIELFAILNMPPPLKRLKAENADEEWELPLPSEIVVDGARVDAR